jgi:hypothetical protein
MKRIVQPEMLDTFSPADPRALRSRRDLRRVNACMGNDAIMAKALKEFFPAAPKALVEFGAGDGNFLLHVAQKLNWKPVRATLLDRQKNVSAETLAAFSKHGWRAEAVVADVFDWPASSAAVVVANLFLHHFEEERLKALLRIICRRAKSFVAVEPRRAPLPLFFSRMLWAMGCNDVTRHDATVSVRAGFAGGEISARWPDRKNWRLTERRAGVFSHLFTAQKISGNGRA